MKTKQPKFHGSDGFALVITLSLMILLTVVAVGLLSLSAVSLRSTGQSQAKSEAQANARLALMIAIGELQKQLGPDQRVSANSSILAESAVRHPHWTGVWDSWKAGPADPANPTPDALSAHQTIPGARSVPSGMSPTYAANRADHFRSWLLSLNPNEASNIATARDLQLTGTRMPAANATAVQLVAEGSLGKGANAADFVSARLLNVQPGATGGSLRGRYGWWIGDESQKARVMSDSHESERDSTLAGRLSRQQAPGSMGTRSIIGLQNITNDSQLAALPSLASLNLLDGAANRPAQQNFHHVTPFSHQVLADVREGGLKRDLSTLLERPISLSESGDEFMLYKFGTDTQQQVPIQDLAAFYQLYDSSRTGWREGVKYTSSPQNNLLRSGIQAAFPDFGNNQTQDKFLREYTTAYRRPVPIKIQLIVSMTAEPINPAPVSTRENPNPDTHKLRLGILPAITMWNPSNLPIVMNLGDPEVHSHMIRLSYLPFLIRWNKNNGGYLSEPVNLAWATTGGSANGTLPGKPMIFTSYLSANNPVVFEPGAVRVFSYPYRVGNFDFNKNSGENFKAHQEMLAGWKPDAFLRMSRSAPSESPPGLPVRNAENARHVRDFQLTFKANDTISFEFGTEAAYSQNESGKAEVRGSGMQFFFIQKSHQNRSGTGGLWDFRHYQFVSRMGDGTQSFNAEMMQKGFPDPTQTVYRNIASRRGDEIIGAATSGQELPFLQFALMAASETSEQSSGAFGGRKFASRPFLHSTPLRPPFIDKVDGGSLYNYAWNWWVEDINSIFEANVQVTRDGFGFYGGGLSDLFGSTHVVQQELPIVPPVSIAALSSAHLGGFSLSDVKPAGALGAHAVTAGDFQRVTATGYAGLFPQAMQAIGNSYAHPHIPADKAYTDWQRHFQNPAGQRSLILADHSYLANKALWDDFFFSSISPQPSSVRAFGGVNRTARQVAGDFFFNDKPLPNRRITPYTRHLDEAGLNQLFTRATAFRDGLADQIAAHLLVEGPFNVNSSSVEAWKTLLSSLRGKPVAYLDKNKALAGVITPDEATPSGTPVASFTLPNSGPAGASSDPKDPAQWLGWRELTDTEINELALAIVKQVKLRGPFLSLSEFVNRRLDSANTDLSVKGALQAALDDQSVSINAGFRNNARQFSSAEQRSVNAVFPKAMEGPVAYGSAAYVDQADILRNFAAQLTPRGDTFVVRTYGDALDASGNVIARAWCEAVVQRVPDYFDPVDKPHVRQANLISASNKLFGRKIEIVSFRWLNPDEV